MILQQAHGIKLYETKSFDEIKPLPEEEPG